MRWVVNGKELPETGEKDLQYRLDRDRVWVKTDDGWRIVALVTRGTETLISFRGRQYSVSKKSRKSTSESASDSGEIRSPMPGMIVSVPVEVGESVARGQTILVIEAMKTQISLPAPFDGVVKELAINQGDQVKSGVVLAILEKVAKD